MTIYYGIGLHTILKILNIYVKTIHRCHLQKECTRQSWHSMWSCKRWRRRWRWWWSNRGGTCPPSPSPRSAPSYPRSAMSPIRTGQAAPLTQSRRLQWSFSSFCQSRLWEPCLRTRSKYSQYWSLSCWRLWTRRRDGDFSQLPPMPWDRGDEWCHTILKIWRL